MRLSFLAVTLLTLPVLSAGAQVAPKVDKAAPAKDDSSSLKPGSNLPGPITPYNVTGPWGVQKPENPMRTPRGRFHCLVTEYGLDPVVLLIAREVDLETPVRNLLTQLDNAIEKNPSARLHAFVVILSDDLADVVEDDVKRDELAGKVRELGDSLSLKHVILCLSDKPSLEKYGLDDNTALTAVLYRKLRVEASFSLPRDKLTDQAVAEIMAAVTEKLGTTRK